MLADKLADDRLRSMASHTSATRTYQLTKVPQRQVPSRHHLRRFPHRPPPSTSPERVSRTQGRHAACSLAQPESSCTSLTQSAHPQNPTLEMAHGEHVCLPQNPILERLPAENAPIQIEKTTRCGEYVGEKVCMCASSAYATSGAVVRAFPPYSALVRTCAQAWPALGASAAVTTTFAGAAVTSGRGFSYTAATGAAATGAWAAVYGTPARAVCGRGCLSQRYKHV